MSRRLTRAARTIKPDAGSGRITLGVIRGLFGVRGWLRLQSYTEPADNILQYSPWHLAMGAQSRLLVPRQGQWHGPGLIVQLGTEDGGLIADREAAAPLVGAEVQVAREALPPAPAGEVYWADLVGLEVHGADGVALGRVQRVMDSPAHPILEVVAGEQRQLIPFVRGAIIREVDLEAGRIDADWLADYAL